MPHTPALLATLLALCVALTACSNDEGGSDGPELTDSQSGSADTSGSTSPTEPAEDGLAGEEAVMIGDHPHRPACQLFPPTDAVEVLRFADEGEFDQEALTRSVSEEDGPDPGAVDNSLATTSCHYRLGDAADTTVRIDVKEYADERSARSRWTAIRRFGEGRLPPGLTDGPRTFEEMDAALRTLLQDAQESIGGVRVPGVDRRILWRTGSTEFIATVDNLFLTFDRAENFGFTPRLTRRDAALAERVLVRALEHAADTETPSTLLPPLFSQDEDWPPFLDPCALLDEEVAQTLLGRPTARVRSSSVDFGPDVNLRGDSGAGRSSENSCEREVEDRLGTAELLVQYVAPQDTAEEVLDSFLGNLAFGDTTPSRAQVDQIRDSMVPGGLVDVDASYVFVVGGQRARYWSYLLLDRYVLQLTGSLPRGTYGSRSVDTRALRDAGELLAANLAAKVSAESTD